MSHHRSLRRAADILNIRQSTLSRRLRDIEHLLGTALFERSSGGTRPTAAGQEFLQKAQWIVEETDAAFARLKSRGLGETGRLTIGIYASFSAGNLRATLIEHRDRFPEVSVHTVDGGRDRLLGDLAARAIDVAIMTTGVPNSDVRELPLWSERVIVALPGHHPLCAYAAVRWSQIFNEQFLVPQRGLGPELEHLLATKLNSSAAQRIVRQDVSLDRLLSLVSAGYGVVLMLEGAAGVHCDGVTYRELHDDQGPTRLNFMAYWRHANSNPTLRPFLSMLRERYPDIGVGPPAP